MEEDNFDLTVKVKTIDILKARMIINSTKELATMRGLTIACVSIVECAPFAPNWVEISDYQSSEISPEYTPTPSAVHSVKECHITEEVQLRMIEDTTKSHIIVAIRKISALIPFEKLQFRIFISTS